MNKNERIILGTGTLLYLNSGFIVIFMGYIYRIINKIDRKSYIGQTYDIDYR